MSTSLIAHVLSAMDRMTRANPRVCGRAMNFTRSFMGVVSFHGMPQHAGDLLPMSPVDLLLMSPVRTRENT
jgi:hypothetical protein